LTEGFEIGAVRNAIGVIVTHLALFIRTSVTIAEPKPGCETTTLGATRFL
jgi:hypothetical protein